MRTNKKTVMAVIGVPVLLLSLAACASRAANDAYDLPDAPATNAAADKVAEVKPGAAALLVAPVGIATEKLIAKSVPQMGAVVTDDKGFFLYRFDKDTKGAAVSACNGNCAAVWPPVLSDGNPKLDGVSANLVGSITRDDGATQLTLGGWPLYRYLGDTAPGQWKGQLVNGTWFVSAPDGQRNLSCLPTTTPTAVPPPSATTAPPANGTSNTGGSGYGY